MKILNFSDPSHGWIDISIGSGSERHTLTVSDMPNDCMGELAAATTRLIAGSGEERIEFSLEPDFATLCLTLATDLVQLRLFHPHHSNAILDTSYPLDAFARELKIELRRIRPLFDSPEGWTQPFPEKEFSSLP